MLSTQNSRFPVRLTGLTIFLLFAIRVNLCASEEPAWLTIIPDQGKIVLDSDTLELNAPTEIEISPGEHVLKFFPYHTASYWAHRYLIYPFTIGSAGKRTIDLTRSDIFTIRTDPHSAKLYFRGRFLGRTPGDFYFLLGTGDSVVVRMEGYQDKALHLDRLHDYGTELFYSLEPVSGDEFVEDDLATYTYSSPLRKLISPDLMASLGSGAILLAIGAHFNQQADEYYDQYLRMLGTNAREEAYSKARRNDRISKATFIAGDLALGVFGYMLIRRFVFPAEKQAQGDKPSRLSVKVLPHKAGLALKF
jgi:hypothetical protein